MLRFLFFIFLIAFIVACVVRWIIPILSYSKWFEGSHLSKFRKYMENKKKVKK